MPHRDLPPLSTAFGRERRKILKLLGLGAAGLPVAGALARLAHAADDEVPKRLVLFFSSSGQPASYFWPAGGPDNFELNLCLQPLAAHKQTLNIVRGLDYRGGTNHAHGMRSAATAGAPDSVDVTVAQRLGLDPIRLGVAPGSGFDSHWVYKGGAGINHPASPTQVYRSLFGGIQPEPNPGEIEPPIVTFRRATAALNQGQVERLHTALADSPAEQSKLVTYLETLRQRASTTTETPTIFSCEGPPLLPRVQASAGLADNYVAGYRNIPALIDAQIDNLVGALTCDVSRVATLQVMHANANAQFDWAGVSRQHHVELSHYSSNSPTGPIAQEFAQTQRWLATKFGELLDRLKVDDPLCPGRTILDNSAVVWLTEVNGDNNHLTNSVPTIVAGGGGGTLRQGGQYLQLGGRNHGDFLLTLCHVMGLTDLTSYGVHGSDGVISELLV